MKFILLVLVYLAPSIISWITHKYNPLRITLLNIFFGWTIIVWFVLLIDAFKTDKLSEKIPSRRYAVAERFQASLQFNRRYNQLPAGFREYKFSHNPSNGEMNAITRAKVVMAIKAHGSLDTYDTLVMNAIKENSKRLIGKDELKVEIEVAKQTMNELKHSNQDQADKQLVESIAGEMGLYYNPLLHPIKAIKNVGNPFSEIIHGIKEYNQDPESYMAAHPSRSWNKMTKGQGKLPTVTYLDVLCDQIKNHEEETIKRVMSETTQRTSSEAADAIGAATIGITSPLGKQVEQVSTVLPVDVATNEESEPQTTSVLSPNTVQVPQIFNPTEELHTVSAPAALEQTTVQASQPIAEEPPAPIGILPTLQGAASQLSGKALKLGGLKEMLDDGLITPQDYDEQKKKILGAI